MKKWRFVFLCLGLGLFIITGCAKTLSEVQTDDKIVVAPVYVQMDDKIAVAPANVQPGLAVLYFEDFYRHISDMPTGERALKEGKPGKPIPYLNHRFGNGTVFDSGQISGIGVQMNGFIRFPSAGRYLLKAKSNDGIRIFINQMIVIDDPNWHSGGDRFSGEASVEVGDPGWYSFFLQYFQRKGTAMLELYWQVPGQAGYRIVPADAFGHIPAPSKNN